MKSRDVRPFSMASAAALMAACVAPIISGNHGRRTVTIDKREPPTDMPEESRQVRRYVARQRMKRLK